MIQTGGTHTCGIDENNEIICFGSDDENIDYGQVLQSPNGSFVGMDTGLYHNCAVNIDRDVECWGAGTTTGSTEPHYGQSMVPFLMEMSKVSVGGYHSCALDVNGDVTCWGALQVLAPEGPFVDISLGICTTSCGLRIDGSVGVLECWTAEQRCRSV